MQACSKQGAQTFNDVERVKTQRLQGTATQKACNFRLLHCAETETENNMNTEEITTRPKLNTRERKDCNKPLLFL